MGLENFDERSCGFGAVVKRREAMHEAETAKGRRGYGGRSYHCHTKREGHFSQCEIGTDNQPELKMRSK